MKTPKLTAALAIALLFALQASAQKGKQFPQLPGETLKGQNMEIPAQTRGKRTLIGLAYSKKSDDLLKQWYSPIYNTFIEPPSTSLFPQDEYDINMYFVALLKGIYSVADGKIMKEMRDGIDPRYHERTLVYAGNIKDYRKSLNLDNKDLPYFFVLDNNGKIVYHTSGAYSRKKLTEIMRAVGD